MAILEASHWHVPLYLDALEAGAEIVAVSDRDPAVAERTARRYGARPFAGWQAAVDAPGLDVVFAFGRHVEMPAIARALVERRLPFSLEKPGGLAAADVEAVAEAAERHGVPAAVPFVQRFGPLAEWLARPAPLDHAAFRFIAGPPSRYPAAGCAWMLDPAQAGGGCFINLGIHFLDLFARLAGEPIARVAARVHRRAHRTAVEDHAVALLETATGRSATVEVGYLFPSSPRKREVSYYASGAGGFVSIGDDGAATFTDAAGSCQTQPVDVDSDPLYPRYVECVLAGLGERFAGLPGLAELRAAMVLVDRAYASARAA